MIWHVYLITCSAPGDDCGKRYIGITKTAVYERFGMHFRSAKKDANAQWPLAVAMKTHWEFEFEVTPLCDCISKENALALEALFIDEYNSRFPNGFNLAGRGSDYAKRIYKRMFSAESQRKAADTKRMQAITDPIVRARLLVSARKGIEVKRQRAKTDAAFREKWLAQLHQASRQAGRMRSRFGRRSSFARDIRQGRLL